MALIVWCAGSATTKRCSGAGLANVIAARLESGACYVNLVGVTGFIAESHVRTFLVVRMTFSSASAAVIKVTS